MGDNKKKPSGNDIDSYKELLKQALALGDRLDVKTKEKIIEYKGILSDYIKLVDSYASASADYSSEGQWSEREETESQMRNTRDELENLGTEIAADIEKIKATFS